MKTIDKTIGTAIQTRSGLMFDFANPQQDSIDLHDIAHALALTNRYGGHTSDPYSVAQHCVLCSEQAPPGLEMEALLHDAAEAYIGDVPSPLKQMLPDFRATEKRVEAAIAEKFGVPTTMSPAVKMVDTRMLVTEAVQLGFRWWRSLNCEPFDLTIRPWSWKWAKRRFVARYYELVR
jgi:hypothetical protein